MKNRFRTIEVVIFLTLAGIPINSHAAFVCKPGGSESFIQTVRNFFWMIVGFPGTDEYSCVTGGSAAMESLISKIGLVGEIEQIRSEISAPLYAILGSTTSCSALPSSGSSMIGTSKTVYYESPTLSIPTTYPGAGGKYSKRLRYVDSSTGVTIKFEFDCSSTRMVARRTVTRTASSTDVVVFYDATTSTKYIDTFIYDNGSFSSQKISFALGLRVDTSTSKFQMWLGRTGYDPSTNEFDAYRFAAHANYSTQEATIHYHDLSSDNAITISNYQAVSDINSTVVTATEAPSTGNATDMRIGCTPDFNTSTSSIAATTQCTGLSLSAAPATAFGDSFSMESVQLNVYNRINSI